MKTISPESQQWQCAYGVNERCPTYRSRLFLDYSLSLGPIPVHAPAIPLPPTKENDYCVIHKIMRGNKCTNLPKKCLSHIKSVDAAIASLMCRQPQFIDDTQHNRRNIDAWDPCWLPDGANLENQMTHLEPEFRHQMIFK